jgi:HEAT repeat protein
VISGEMMKHVDGLSRRIVDDLISSLDPADPRLIAFQGMDAEKRVSHLAVSLLRDASVATAIAHRTLLLLPEFATEDFITETLRAMRTRPDLAHVAGRGLRKLRSIGVIDELGALLLDLTVAPQARTEAAAVLGDFGDARAKPFLIRALYAQQQEAAIMRAVAHGLGYIQLLEGSTDATNDICRLLSSDSPDVRLAALNALCNMSATQALERIEELVRDPGVTESGERVGTRAAEVVRILRC